MIEESKGYKKLHDTIVVDRCGGWSLEERMKKLAWAVERAKHYEKKTGVPAGEILTMWESRRDYWYMNFYQDANQPLLEGDSVRVFETNDELIASVGDSGFRCPYCHGVSKSPCKCTSGIMLSLINGSDRLEVCNWNVGGLFRDLGQGAFVFVKAAMRGERIFKPITWE